MGRFAGCLDARRGTSLGQPRAHGKLIDQIFRTFDHACDLDELDLAHSLLAVVNTFVSAETAKQDGAGQPYADRLVQAHFRLLELRCQD